MEQIPQQEHKEENINLYEILFKYLVYWHWFVAGVVVMLIGAWLWLRYQAPVYNVQASVLIQEQDKRSNNAAAGPLAAMQDLGVFSMTNNFDNEVEILRSRTLLKKVVTTLNLYTSITRPRTFGHAVPLYKKSPVEVYMTPAEADKLYAPMELEMHLTTDKHLSVEAVYTVDADADEETMKKDFDKFPAVMHTPAGIVTFMLNDSILVEDNMELDAVINTPVAVAKSYGEYLTVEPSSKTTTIARLAVQNTDRLRAMDFITCLVALYNQDANDEKNEVAEKTAEFIEERLGIINEELGTTESRLAAFKQRSGLTTW